MRKVSNDPNGAWTAYRPLPTDTSAQSQFQSQSPSATAAAAPSIDACKLDRLNLIDQLADHRLAFGWVGCPWQSYDPPRSTVSYVSKPIRDDSGREVELIGDVALQIAFEPATNQKSTLTREKHFHEVLRGTDRLVTDFVQISDSGSRLTFVLGLRERVPFKTYGAEANINTLLVVFQPKNH
jgi:hypothetical protein